MWVHEMLCTPVDLPVRRRSARHREHDQHYVMPLDAGIAHHQHIHLRHPPFRAQQRSRTPRKRTATGQAYHASHSVAGTIAGLGGHIGHPFEHLGIAGGRPLQLDTGTDDQCLVAGQVCGRGAR
jgi:hypothetical protein